MLRGLLLGRQLPYYEGVLAAASVLFYRSGGMDGIGSDRIAGTSMRRLLQQYVLLKYKSFDTVGRVNQESYVRRLGYSYFCITAIDVPLTDALLPLNSSRDRFYCPWKQLYCVVAHSTGIAFYLQEDYYRAATRKKTKVQAIASGFLPEISPFPSNIQFLNQICA